MGVNSLRGLTVLLVDDENFSRKLVADMLTDMGRPQIIQASDGARAIEALDDHHVDLIISDFNMPEVHGLQLLRFVRTLNNDAKRSVPFSMLTGYSGTKLVDTALALDANAFLVKPVSQDALVKRITQMLAQVDSSPWLKDIAVYESIDVDGILDEMFFPGKKNAKDANLDPLPDEQALFNPSQRIYESGPVEIKGVGKKKSKKGKFGKKDLKKDVIPAQGSVEVRGLDNQYIPASARKISGHTGGKAPERLCLLEDLPESAILARDVSTADGRLFMHTGTQLTPLIISILDDLHKVGHPVNNIWIVT